ncbi:MAG: hypothetical protein ACHP65_09960, partial [Legionellales bacterium]
SILNRELLAYYKSLSAWLNHLARQIKYNDQEILPPPEIYSLVSLLEHTLMEYPMQIDLLARANWYREFNQRVHALDALIKRVSVQDSITLNQEKREAM